MRARFSVTIAIGLFLSAGSSQAQDAEARARASKSADEAQSAFERHDYVAAATAFEQAAALDPHPAAWLGAAEAWQDAGDWVRAATDCDRALALREVAPKYVEEAEAGLAEAKTHVATLDLRGDPSFTVSVDGSEARALPQLIRLAPGNHDVRVVEGTNGKRMRQLMTLAANETKVISLQPTPPPTRLFPTEARHVRGPDGPSILAFGASGLFLAGGIVFGGLTLADKSSFDDSPSQDALDRFKRDRAVCDVLLGVAVLTAGVGVFLWATEPTTKENYLDSPLFGSRSPDPWARSRH